MLKSSLRIDPCNITLRYGKTGNKKNSQIVLQHCLKRSRIQRCCGFYYPHQACLATNQVVNRFERGLKKVQHRFSTPVRFPAMLQGMMHVFVARLPKLKASGKDDISCSGSTSCNMVLLLLSERKERDFEPLIICNDVRAC